MPFFDLLVSIQPQFSVGFEFPLIVTHMFFHILSEVFGVGQDVFLGNFGKSIVGLFPREIRV